MPTRKIIFNDTIFDSYGEKDNFDNPSSPHNYLNNPLDNSNFFDNK